VVSPYTSAGHISHTYTDHVSVLKFIERNWDLGTISKRSRDNLPNPKPMNYKLTQCPHIDGFCSFGLCIRAQKARLKTSCYAARPLE
jgi:Phosphoesterase family